MAWHFVLFTKIKTWPEYPKSALYLYPNDAIGLVLPLQNQQDQNCLYQQIQSVHAFKYLGFLTVDHLSDKENI